MGGTAACGFHRTERPTTAAASTVTRGHHPANFRLRPVFGREPGRKGKFAVLHRGRGGGRGRGRARGAAAEAGGAVRWDTMDPFTVAQWVLRAVLALVFVGMGILHFMPRVRETMAAMIPPAMRRTGLLSPSALVTISGVAEILGGVGLLAPWQPVRFAAGIALIALLVAVFPANAYAAQHPERFGRAAVAVGPRLAGQVVLGLLVLVAVV